MQDLLSKKQVEFIINSNAKWNLAHGSVRCGKTIATLYRFLQAVILCPDSLIYMIGHTSDTIYRNIVMPIMQSDELSLFRPFATWQPGSRTLLFRGKSIKTIGAKDEGSTSMIQGLTASLLYCDEMTLYPDNILDMLDTRLSCAHSMAFGSMNPTYPDHKVKQWIDKAHIGDRNYYALHFTLDDNPFVDDEYKSRIKNSTSGVFYKRNYLGLWCLAEGSIFDFFDKDVHVVDAPPTAAEYWIAGIDYGTNNPFACVLIGVNTGRFTGMPKRMWVEKEYYWDYSKKGRQKTSAEFARDVQAMLEPYAVRAVYLDPSAAGFRLDLSRLGIHTAETNNDVGDGLRILMKELGEGGLVICRTCPNLIREVEGYVWDSKKAERGRDEPLKQNDHAIDALRYAVATHRVPKQLEGGGETLGGYKRRF